jgi:predicted permease
MRVARLRSLARALLLRRRLERDMDAELELHLEARADDLVAAGLDRATALRRAREELGDPLRWKEQGREARGLGLFDRVATDVRYGLRSLRRTPGFALAAILSIAVGIGVNTAVFSLVNAVLLRLMPVRDPASLVLLTRHDGTRLRESFPYPFYQMLREARLLEGAVAQSSIGLNVEGDDTVERLSGELVSGEYFNLLGVRAHIGRVLTPDDNRVPGGHPIAVMSYGYWQRRFGGDPQVVGRTLRVNNVPITIVGVAPPGFQGLTPGSSPDLRLPIAMQPQLEASPSRLSARRDWWMPIVARLRPGVTRQAAEQEIEAAFQRYLATGPPLQRPQRILLEDGSRGRTSLRDRLQRPLTVLTGLAMAVLLLVCLNVTNLMLARTAARRRELSMRIALGAGRGRILSQLLVEALLVAVSGGVLGAVVAAWAAPTLGRIAAPSPGGSVLHVTMDLPVLLFAAAMALLTGVVCGLSPGFSAWRTSVLATLSTESRSVAAGRVTGRRALVAAQIAVSFTLLVAAGLFMRTLVNLRDLDLGFETEHLLVMRIDPTLPGFAPPQLRAFYDEVTARVSAVPGVRGASIAVTGPMARSSFGSGLTLDTGERDDDFGPERNAVSPGYFSTIGAHMAAGREFTANDVASGHQVAVVNEAFAKQYFGGQAIGRRIGPGGVNGVATYTIVGVARDGKFAELRERIAPFWYVPYQQFEPVGQSDTAVRIRRGLLTLLVRSIGPPDTVAGDVRRAIAGIDQRILVFDVKTMRQQIADLLVFERLMASLAGGFAIVAILLASLGLYGVTSYDTTARTREIGVRMALGAMPSTILGLVLRQTLVLIGLGLGAGLALALAGMGYVRSLLFDLQPTDPVVIGSAALIVVAVTVAAAWAPARRATRVDPVTALQ